MVHFEDQLFNFLQDLYYIFSIMFLLKLLNCLLKVSFNCKNYHFKFLLRFTFYLNRILIFLLNFKSKWYHLLNWVTYYSLILHELFRIFHFLDLTLQIFYHNFHIYICYPLKILIIRNFQKFLKFILFIN